MNTKSNTISIPLVGVDSEHCALIVDKGLNNVKGISSHKVELNNNRALITTTDDQETIPEAVKAIRRLGYDVETIKKTFPVLEMTCASCAVSTESMIRSLPGVTEASVNFANATVQVEYIPTLVSPQQMKAAVQSIGYDLIIDESEDAKDALEELQPASFQNHWSHYSFHASFGDRYVLHGYAICQLHHVGFGHACSNIIWKAVLY
jgi:P-type Cu2+ transporter